MVRLKKGKKESAVVYSNEPLDIGKRWTEYGAQLIHIVDLDAAFGSGDNTEIIKRIASEGISVQTGGGIHSIDKAESLIKSGVKRIVIGSRALDKEFLSKIVQEFGEKIAAGVDILNGKFMKSGWRDDSGYKVDDFINYLIDSGVQWIIYTDISRDGMLEGVNIKAVKELSRFKKTNFIISGGISSLEDIEIIKKEAPFIKGVIVGKALYENRIDLRKAINAC